MKRNFVKVLSIVLALMMVITCAPLSSFAANATITGSSSADYEIDNPSFVTLSDTHVYTEELVGKGGEGTDYYNDVVKYNKLLGETFPILNATLEAIEQRVQNGGLRYVFLTGDLTANGEEKNHEMLGNLLRSFQTKMRTIDPKFHIYVIPGNHDINKCDGAYYDENGKQVTAASCATIEQANEILTSAAEFAYFYRDLGYGEADVDYFKESSLNNAPAATDDKTFYDFEDSSGALSYAVSLEDSSGQKMRLVAMDCSMYSDDVNDDTKVIGGVEVQDANTGGYMTDEQLNWVCNQSSAAVNNDEVVIGLNHYAFTPHFAVQPAALKLFIINDWQRISSAVADAGMHYVFSGHQHAPDVSCYTSPNGETIYDVETGSLVNFSNTYRENKFELNGDGSIDFDTVSRDCDTYAQVDLSRCWYEYDDAGNPVITELKYNAGANGLPFGKISKPFSQHYGIYLFAGTRLDATDTGDCIWTDEHGDMIKPSLSTLAKNMISGYLDGKLIDNIIRSGGARSLVESILGTDLKSYLDAMFPGDTITISIITLKKDDVLELADMIMDELDHSLIGYVDGDGNIVRENQLLLDVANDLVDIILDFEIGGHTLGDIAMAAVIANYDCKAIQDNQFPFVQDIVNDFDAIYADIESDAAIRRLADRLVDELLGKTVVETDGEGKETETFQEGAILKLLRGINISTDMINEILPDFAGVLRYPAVRKLLFGNTSKTPDVVTVVNAWAGRLFKDSYKHVNFTTGEVTEKSVTDSASLVESFLFGAVDDYLTDDQIHSVSEVLKYALQSFFVDPTSTAKSDIEYIDQYPFVNNYDLKSEGLMSADSDDYKATINYRKLTPKAPEDAWYQIPTSISVSFGADTTSSKNINWFTIPNITGTDVQIIPYTAGATAADFAGGSTVSFNADTSCETVPMTYPNLDIGILTVGESMSMNRHIAKVTGLEPDTKYTYRVGDADKNIWSEPATLETASGDKSAFSFLFTTDTQSQTQAQYDSSFGKVLQDAKEKAPDYKFILNAGDMVDYGANMRQWEWALGEPGVSDTTVASTAGNHEPKGTNGKDSILTTAFGPSQDTFFAIEHPEQDVSSGIYYDFDYNDMHVMVLNSNNLNDDNTLSTDQVEWLKNSAESSDKTWNVVMMHKSIYSNASHYDDSDVVALREQLSKLMPQLGIDIVFSGHDHVFVRTQFMTNGKVTGKFNSSDVGYNQSGTVYLINGKAGVKDYRLKSDEKVSEVMPLDTMKRVDAANKSSYSVVNVNGGKFTVDTYQLDENGENSTKIDSFTIQKGKLSAPKLTAETASKTSIKLSWNAISGASSYQLYRANSANGQFEKIATLGDTTYTDTGLETGKTYFYKVVAGTGGSASEPSNVAQAKATLPAVLHLKANQKDFTTVQTSWSKVKGAIGYNLYVSTQKDSGYELAASTDGAINARVSNLERGSTYYFKVCATDGVSEGASSYIIKITLK
ncbi:MAG: metallophosphoesterase [Clostridia bacterium]|nr:metallophosphoesterase [Clostridia bacterium]